MPHINIEIKARCNDHSHIRDILNSLDARFVGLDHQIDTYFNSQNGRLKLREGNIENSLIYYQRADSADPKLSNVILFNTEPDSPLKDILTHSIGTKIIVDKKREIYFVDNVKFHIDSVRGLGDFIEIEAIDETGNIGMDRLLEQCNYYLNLFNIDDADLVSGSYSDLLSAQ